MKKAYLLLVALVVAIMLSACSSATNTAAPAATTAASSNPAATTAPNKSGDDEIPLASGATTAGIPDALKAALDAQKTGVPNGKVVAYKVSDQAPKVKTSLADGFKSKGWEDKTASYGGATANASLEQAGGFYLYFQKGGKVAVVMGYPGVMAGLAASDVVYFVISGGQ